MSTGRRGRRGALVAAAAIAAAAIAATVTGVWAHRDPASCSGSGVRIQIFPFRNQGVQCVSGLNTEAADCSYDTTDPENLVSVGCSPGFECDPIPLAGGVVSQCETILYRASLSYSGNNTCAFGGGTFSVSTPSDTFVVSNPVPCLGGSVAPCDPTATSITSELYPYTVQPGDTSAASSADYENGFVHNGGATPPTGDQSGASAMIVDIATVIGCDDNNACTTDVCDPAEQGIDACSNEAIPCDDDNACTTDTCDPATGCTSTPVAPCNDNNLCTTDTCDPATGCVSTPVAPCNDNNLCTTDTCDPAQGCVSTPVAPCDDNNACTTDTCDPQQGCVSTPNSAACDDNNVCTTDTCDPVKGCVHTPVAPCTDNNVCTADTCDPQKGCVFTPTTTSCDDGNVCTTDTCDPVQGCRNVPRPPCTDNNPCTADTCDPQAGCTHTPAIKCSDSDPCTVDTCDPKKGCVFTKKSCDDGNACTIDKCDKKKGCRSVKKVKCNDGNPCTTDKCDPQKGCVFTPRPCDDGDPCTTDTCHPKKGCRHVPNGTCKPLVCRTPGFWSTHGGVAKSVLGAAGGCVEVCGEVLTSSAAKSVGNADAALEALCIASHGNAKLKLVRHLTAFLLNCLVSGAGAGCSGHAELAALFDDCNKACLGQGSTRDIGQCIDAIDCFNNGGTLGPDGSCQAAGDNCHKRSLPPGYRGPADTSYSCSTARKNQCTVVPPGELATGPKTCSAGRRSAGAESCP